VDYKNAFKFSMVISIGFSVTYYIVFGSRGVIEYLSAKQQIRKTHNTIARLEHNIHRLKNSIFLYQQNPFEMEKVARYDFDMGHTNEMVYLLPKTHN
jgi:cell division protein FtsB